MDIEFNPAKNQANLTKQGVSLADVESLEWETAVVVKDARQAYGEIRMISTGYIGDRLHVVVFVDRGTMPHHQPTKGERKRGEPICRNLNRERRFPGPRKALRLTLRLPATPVRAK